jgi:hypothetical protein
MPRFIMRFHFMAVSSRLNAARIVKRPRRTSRNARRQRNVGHMGARWVRRFGPEPARKTRLLGNFLAAPRHCVGDPGKHSDEVCAMTVKRISSAVHRLAQVLEPSGW